jgi:colicin import membrane protein
MDKMVKVGKFIIGGFVALIVIGLFMPSTPSTASKPETTQTESQPKSTVEKVKESIWDSQASAKAKAYLAMSGFSRSGLIHQLEFEGFENSDAAQAVDSLNVDWNEQAVRKAEDYLAMSSFSKSGLTHQLEFEGFSSSQAAYGVANVGK